MSALNCTVCVIGLGYIGLPTASLLGTKGFDVLGVDTSLNVVDTINKGEIHIVEPDLDILVKSAVNSGKLKASLTPIEADVFIISVPTPFIGDHQPDLSFVKSATRSILPYLKQGCLVILESTVPVGTTEHIVAQILFEESALDKNAIYVAHCPERVLPGHVLKELVENDRVVGGIDDASTAKAVEFYEQFVNGKILSTTAKTAEMSKLTENAYRDVNIAFANELSMICDAENINVWELINLANHHPRVNILNPGAGVGGHCIAVDPWFIISSHPQHSRLLKSARDVNDYKPKWVIEKIKSQANKFKHPVIGFLGLAFKADIDDLRESPAIEIVNYFVSSDDWSILVNEPNLKQHQNFDLLPVQEVIDRSDIIVILVDHKPYKRLRAMDLKEKIVIDTRGVV